MDRDDQHPDDSFLQPDDVTGLDQDHDHPSQSTTSIPIPKRRKLTNPSPMWEHFTRIEGGDPTYPMAKCNYCPKEVGIHHRLSSTSAMLAHHKRCYNFKTRQRMMDPTQLTLTHDSSAGAATSASSVVRDLMVAKYDETAKYDEKGIRRAIAEHIILGELPFVMVERLGFRQLLKKLELRFPGISRRTTARDCLAVYLEEKQKLKLKMLELKPRMCFSTDTWTSIQNITYMCVTAHFIDSSWVLHKRIFMFQRLSDHKGPSMAKQLDDCMGNWGLEKVMKITVDNATNNYLALADFRRRQIERFGSTPGAIISDHKNLQVRCSAHILNLIVKEGLDEMSSSVDKMRALVKYVKSSPKRLDSFQQYVANRMQKKGFLQLDAGTRWNSTYIMLESVLDYQSVFEDMLDEDRNLVNYLVSDDGKKNRVPTLDDWTQVKHFVTFLKLFYDVTLNLSASNTVTTHIFFQEVAQVERQLTKFMLDDDPFLSEMARSMRYKYDKYWGEFTRVDPNSRNRSLNKFLMAATLLDPQAKMRWFNWWFSFTMNQNKNDEAKTIVMSAMREVFEEYEKVYGSSLSTPTSTCTSQSSSMGTSSWVFDDSYATYFDPEDRMEEEKSEIDRYLNDKSLPASKNLDILAWWKSNQSVYPVLAQMARDVLAIPISTVPSEALFSIRGRVLDAHRSSLAPSTIEALICTQNWLRSTSDEIEIMHGTEDSTTYDIDRELNENPQEFMARLLG